MLKKTNHHLWRIIIAAIFFLSFQSNANSATTSDYCIARSTQTYANSQSSHIDTKNQPTRAEIKDGYLEIDRNEISLHDKSGKKLQTQKLSDREFSKLISIYVADDGLIWANTRQFSYRSKLEHRTIAPTTKVSEIHANSCGIATRIGRYFDGGCEIASGSFSQTLDRAFVTGFPETIFSIKTPTTWEYRATGANRLPNGAGWYQFDMPETGGALFLGSENQPIYYDGNSLTRIAVPSIPNLISDLEIKRPLGWLVIKNQANKKWFIFSTQENEAKTEPFIFEVLKSAKLLKFNTKNHIRRGALFTSAEKDDVTFVVENKKISMLYDGETRTFAIAPKGYEFISLSNEFNQAADAFELKATGKPEANKTNPKRVLLKIQKHSKPQSCFQINKISHILDYTM